MGILTTKQIGDAAEDQALQYLQTQGLRLITRNYRTPGRGGGEIDLIMRAPDGTTVFVEVRKRASARHGGAAASVGGIKQRRIIFAARHYLMRLPAQPPCRFDVVVMDAAGVQWLQAAFDAY
jgi:putative endonuclease